MGFGAGPCLRLVSDRTSGRSCATSAEDHIVQGCKLVAGSPAGGTVEGDLLACIAFEDMRKQRPALLVNLLDRILELGSSGSLVVLACAGIHHIHCTAGDSASALLGSCSVCRASKVEGLDYEQLGVASLGSSASGPVLGKGEPSRHDLDSGYLCIAGWRVDSPFVAVEIAG
jgi:hypothetical protein